MEGARRLHVDQRGDLLIETSTGTVKQRRPVAYQTRNGVRTAVHVNYAIRRENLAGFVLGSFDPQLPLTIDPVLDYSSFMGGSGDEQATAVVSDGSGNAYVAGVTNSLDFPSAQPRPVLGTDVFLTKVSPGSSGNLFVTYFGGSGDDRPNAISLLSGRIAIAGETNSRDFPVSGTALQRAYGGGDNDAFILQWDVQTGTLLYSSYLGGSGEDRANGVALDFSYRMVVTGSTMSTNFPTNNAIQPSIAGGTDAFVSKVAGNSLVYSTYLGGTGDDRGGAVVLSPAGEAYIAGETASKDFPVAKAMQTASAGGTDGFVTKLAADGSSLAFSTYLGGSGTDRATGIGLDSDLNVFVAGTTGSSDFPVSKASQGSFGGGASDAFLARLSTDGSSFLYSTFLGGHGDDEASALAVTSYGDAFVAGSTNSTDFPLTDPLQGAFAGGSADAFLAQVGSDGAVVQSTWFGGTGADRALGVAVDFYGSAWIVGSTDSTDLPTKQASQPSPGGRTDGFAARISTMGISAANLTVGKDLEGQGTVGLGVPAPAGGVQMTITSSDPAKLLFSVNQKDAGAATVNLTAQAGSQYVGTFYAHGLSDSGSVPFTVSAPGYRARTGTVTLAPSGFLAFARVGSSLTAISFATTTLSPNTPISIEPVVLIPGSFQIAGLEPLRAGAGPVQIGVGISDTTVGAITLSPVSIVGGSQSGDTEFHPKGTGTATISLNTPPGFSTAAVPPLSVTVVSPRLTLRDIVLGKDLQAQMTLQLAAPAPPGLDISIQSSNPAQVLLSTDPARPGSASISVPMAAGGTNATFYAQGLTSTGSVTISASAPQFDPGSATATLSPSGFYMITPGSAGDFTTTQLAAPILTVYSAQLDPSSLAIGTRQTLRAGLAPVQVSLASSNTQVGTVPDSPVTFVGGEGFHQVRFQPGMAGATDLTVGVAPGFVAPSSGRMSKVTVIPPAVKLNDLSVGKDLQTRLSVNLTDPSPSGGLPVTIVSGDPTRVLLSTTANTAGSAQVTITLSPNLTFNSDVYVQALAGTGTVQLTASAPGFTAGTATVRLGPSGFAFDPFNTDLRTTLFARNTDIRLSANLLDAATNAPVTPQSLRAGMASVSVELSSSSPQAGVAAPVVFWAATIRKTLHSTRPALASPCSPSPRRPDSRRPLKDAMRG